MHCILGSRHIRLAARSLSASNRREKQQTRTLPGESVSIPTFTIPWGKVAPRELRPSAPANQQSVLEQCSFTRKDVPAIGRTDKHIDQTCRILDLGMDNWNAERRQSRQSGPGVRDHQSAHCVRCSQGDVGRVLSGSPTGS